MEIDELDKRSLVTLMQNFRLSYRKISKKLNVSVVSIINRVKKLENNNIIKNYSSMIDYEKLGFNISAIIEIKIKKGKKDVDKEVYEGLKMNPYLNALYSITGHYDIIAVAKFRNRKELNLFIEKMSDNEKIEETNTQYILDVIKDDNIIKLDSPLLK